MARRAGRWRLVGEEPLQEHRRRLDRGAPGTSKGVLAWAQDPCRLGFCLFGGNALLPPSRISPSIVLAALSGPVELGGGAVDKARSLRCPAGAGIRTRKQ